MRAQALRDSARNSTQAMLTRAIEPESHETFGPAAVTPPRFQLLAALYMIHVRSQRGQDLHACCAQQTREEVERDGVVVDHENAHSLCSSTRPRRDGSRWVDASLGTGRHGAGGCQEARLQREWALGRSQRIAGRLREHQFPLMRVTRNPSF
jgi:hypothetical protein